MYDREPTNPGRVLITPESGSPFYATLEMADNPVNPGTPPTKQNLLQDTTAALFGLSAAATVNDAFVSVGNLLRLIIGGSAVLNLTLVDGAGLPVKGVTVNGLFDSSGELVVSDNQGKASGTIEANGTEISISGYLDIQDYSETITAVQGSTTDKTVTLTRRTSITISSSRSLKFSGNIASFDICLCGAGGGSGYASPPTSGPDTRGTRGGGGGYVLNIYDLLPTAGEYYVLVGSGGSGGTSTSQSGKAGGYSQLSRDGESLGIAMGGAGSSNRTGIIGVVDGKVGVGNGAGGDGYDHNNYLYATNGVSGNTRVFEDPSGDLPGGGGAGGGDVRSSSLRAPATAGSAHGGLEGENGETPGGGAGGAYNLSSQTRLGSRGGNGRAYVRMEVA